jgi:hypothetical protein
MLDIQTAKATVYGKIENGVKKTRIVSGSQDSGYVDGDAKLVVARATVTSHIYDNPDPKKRELVARAMVLRLACDQSGCREVMDRLYAGSGTKITGNTSVLMPSLCAPLTY